MSEAWTMTEAPEVAAPAGGPLRWDVTSLPEVSASRRDLRTTLMALPDGHGRIECVDELLSTFEELVSNGVRHGHGPVEVTVTVTDRGYLIDVSHDAADQPPVPSVDRDPGSGGLGLPMVARLAAGHDWFPRQGREHVWACIPCAA